MHKPSEANNKLHVLYRSLRDRVDPERWPDRAAVKKLWRGLHRASNGTVQPNHFEDGHGPLQVTAFWPKRCTMTDPCHHSDDDAAALAIFRDARRQIFAPLVAELRSGMRPVSQAVADRGLWVPSEASLHVIVRVFSEHPSLLEPKEAKAWRPVSETQCEALGEAVGAHLATHQYEQRSGRRQGANGPPRHMGLVVHSYALTADGSMLILFEEEEAAGTTAGVSVLSLREELGAVGEAVLGPLNSRPKALLHLSVMRLLDWPDEEVLSEGERAHISATVRKWTEALARDRLPSGGAVPSLGAPVRLSALELVRDVNWMMTDRKTYRRYCLGRYERTGGCGKRREGEHKGERVCWSGLVCT